MINYQKKYLKYKKKYLQLKQLGGTDPDLGKKFTFKDCINNGYYKK